MCNTNIVPFLIFCFLCLLLVLGFYAMYAMCRESNIKNKYANFYNTVEKLTVYLSDSKNLTNDSDVFLYIHNVCLVENLGSNPPTIFACIALLQSVRKISLDDFERKEKIRDIVKGYI